MTYPIIPLTTLHWLTLTGTKDGSGQHDNIMIQSLWFYIFVIFSNSCVICSILYQTFKGEIKCFFLSLIKIATYHWSSLWWLVALVRFHKKHSIGPPGVLLYNPFMCRSWLFLVCSVAKTPSSSGLLQIERSCRTQKCGGFSVHLTGNILLSSAEREKEGKKRERESFF